jgi:ATP-dependent protease ClpP protease subunit
VRIIFLGTPIDDQIANLGIAALLHLESEDPGTDISLYTTATAAQSTPGLAIYDTIRFQAQLQARPSGRDAGNMCRGSHETTSTTA